MIYFFCEDIDYKLTAKSKTKKWLAEIVKREGKKVGDINIIFCSDEYLLEVNKKYLNHDYYTDIITFNYNTEKINGDLFISVDRVNENEKTLNVPRETEMNRVMAHGVLHLLGYKDKTEKEEKEIREKENIYLEVLKNIS